MFEIRFHKSTSKNFRLVLKNARLFSNFTEGEVNTITTTSEEIFNLWDSFNLVFHNSKSWAGSIVLHNGSPLVSYKQRSDWFYSILDLKNCYKWFSKAYDKEEYCNDGGCWGCKRLNSVLRHYTSSFWSMGCWYNYGKFTDPKTWIIDKRKISLILKEEARIKLVDTCPVYIDTAIDKYVGELADLITVDDVRWKVKFAQDVTDAGSCLIPIGVEPIIYEPSNAITLEPPAEQPKRTLTESEWADEQIELYHKKRL